MARSVSKVLEAAREQVEHAPSTALDAVVPLLTHAEPEVRAQATLLAGTANRNAGKHDDALPHLEAAISDATAASDPVLAAQACLNLGKSLRTLGDFDGAQQRITEAHELAEEAGNDELAVDALNMLASIIDARGEHQRALDTLNRARRKVLTANLGDVLLATIDTNIGSVHRTLGNHADALEHLKEAYDRFKTAGVSNRASASNLVSLGNLYVRMGKTDEATRFYEEARDAGAGSGDNLVVAAALNNLAGIALENLDADRAEHFYRQAYELSVQAGSLRYQADNLDGLGRVFLARNDMQRASEVLLQAFKLARELGYREGELDAGLGLATALMGTGQALLAIDTLKESAALAEETGDREHLIRAHEKLSHALESVGDFQGALQHARRFHEEENTLYNEQSEEHTRQLTVKFELERAKHQADMYRMQTQYLQEANEAAEAMVLARTRELEEAQIEIVTRLAVAAEYRDDVTGAHTRRVGRNAAAIGYAMGYPERDLEVLFTAARLHDVGKIGIPDTILHKSGRLEPDEMELMRQHTVIGARILSSGGSKMLHLSETISLWHHERFDGRGYPHGLAGETIPAAARIVAVSDVLDALTHVRPYKPAWPVSEALAEIASQKGRQFDPDAVEACLAVFSGPGCLSPTEDPPDWPALLEQLKELGAERGFPAVKRSSVW